MSRHPSAQQQIVENSVLPQRATDEQKACESRSDSQERAFARCPRMAFFLKYLICNLTCILLLALTLPLLGLSLRFLASSIVDSLRLEQRASDLDFSPTIPFPTINIITHRLTSVLHHGTACTNGTRGVTGLTFLA